MNIHLGSLILKGCVAEIEIKDFDDSNGVVEVSLMKGKKGEIVQTLKNIKVSKSAETLVFDNTPQDGRLHSFYLVVKCGGKIVGGPTQPVVFRACSRES